MHVATPSAFLPDIPPILLLPAAPSMDGAGRHVLSALAAKPTLDVRRIAYRGDPNLIQLNIRIVRSVKRSHSSRSGVPPTVSGPDFGPIAFP
jgi:hypothetical protein